VVSRRKNILYLEDRKDGRKEGKPGHSLGSEGRKEIRKAGQKDKQKEGRKERRKKGRKEQ
jgi:hypothetical protein